MTEERIRTIGDALVAASETETDLERSELRYWTLGILADIKEPEPGEDPLGPPIIQHPILKREASRLYSIAKEWYTLKKSIAKIRSTPSEFASSTWLKEQEKYEDILCMRPPKRTGLPLSTLHAAFYHFKCDAKMPFQESFQTIPADRLVRVMGNPFNDEFSDRTRIFNDCIDPLFQSDQWQMSMLVNPSSERRSEMVDASFAIKGSTVAFILRADKNELGESGDPYMRLARCYHMYVEMLQDRVRSPDSIRALKHGVPIFLLCVDGAVLTVSGGVYDGKAVIIEPLCTIWMLMDPMIRQELAQVLYAPQRAADEIKISLSIDSAPLIPSVPRVYSTCQQLDGPPVPITFQSAFHPSWDKPIFDATLNGSRNVLAKMVSHAYGQNVHEFLGNRGFAPKLLGVCTLEGHPTIYVMERLDESWVSLDAWDGSVESDRRDAVRSDIGKGIEYIIGLLEEKGYVHGDLRASNIMVCENSLELKVVDFDWAGEAGQTCYPFDRSGGVKEWPRGPTPNGPIPGGHDSALAGSWFATFLP